MIQTTGNNEPSQKKNTSSDIDFDLLQINDEDYDVEVAADDNNSNSKIEQFIKQDELKVDM